MPFLQYEICFYLTLPLHLDSAPIIETDQGSKTILKGQMIAGIEMSRSSQSERRLSL